MNAEQEKQMERELTEAGMKFDGHVTNGSFQEQMKVFKKYLTNNGKIEIDVETGCAYIYFQPERRSETGVVAKTKQLTVNADYDSEGKLLGVELTEGLTV